MSTETTMHVFQISDDDTDMVVAADPDDAAVVWSDYTGDTLQDGQRFEQLPDDRMLKIGNDDGGWNDPRQTFDKRSGCHFLEMSCAEWSRHNGRGYLASTEW